MDFVAVRAALAAVAVGGALLCATGAEAMSDELVAGINNYGLQLRSGKLLVRSETTFLAGPGAGTTETAEEEFFFDGVRSRLHRTIRRPGADPGAPSEVRTLLTIFDGEKVTVSYSPTPPPIPDTETFVALNLPEDLEPHLSWPSGMLAHILDPQVLHYPPLGDGLRSMWHAEQVGEEEVAGLRCLHLVAPAQKIPGYQITRSWWTSPEKGYAFVQYADKVEPIRPVGTVYKHRVCTVEKWMEVGEGIWLPEVSVTRTYGQLVGEEEKLLKVETSTILAAAVNIPIGDDVFTPPGG